MALRVVYFQIMHRLGRPHYVWDKYLYSVLEEVEVRVCVVLLCCVGGWWKEGRRWNPVPAHSLLFSKSTKGVTRLNIPIRQRNHYQTVLYAFSTYRSWPAIVTQLKKYKFGVNMLSSIADCSSFQQQKWHILWYNIPSTTGTSIRCCTHCFVIYKQNFVLIYITIWFL